MHWAEVQAKTAISKKGYVIWGAKDQSSYCIWGSWKKIKVPRALKKEKNVRVDTVGKRLFTLKNKTKNHLGSFDPVDLVTCNTTLLKITNPIKIREFRVKKFLVTDNTVHFNTQHINYCSREI